MKVIITGYSSITKLPDEAIKRINKLIELKAKIVIGDNYGVEAEVQKYLKSQNYNNVKVYHVGEQPRNNAGFNCAKVPQTVITSYQRPGKQKRGNGHLAREKYLCEMADYALVVLSKSHRELMGDARFMDQSKVRLVTV